ncbi:MAG TPA: hypothetical protein VER04_25630, partial [Polyangiaceae bacterium]|nr:hypothetical protein [Polyangiaceae bacterium]
SLSQARAEAALPENWLSAQVNESGQRCVPLAEQRQADRLLLACGIAGVWEVSLGNAGPKFVRSYAFSGNVIGFVREPDGRLWVILQTLEARPFSVAPANGAAVFPDLAPSGAAAAPATPSTTPITATVALSPTPPRQRGRVESTTPGEVVISLGSADGLSRSGHIEFALRDAEDHGEEGSPSGESLAVGVVTSVSPHGAHVRLGLNETVPVGALAIPTLAQSSASLSAPPRVSELWELELFARPFAALDELGGGILLSGSIGYRFKHLHLQAAVDPLAFAAVQTKRSVGAANAAAIASYDSPYFEMGLGLGAQTMNETSPLVGPGSGLAVVQLFRFGARDGLNLTARSNIVLFHSQFQFGGMVASGQIPLTRGYWLLLNGGGGNVGYGYGEMGLRTLLSGNGLAGSKYLTVTAGAVGVFRSGTCDEFFNSCSEETSYGGPMAGVGGEWRF